MKQKKQNKKIKDQAEQLKAEADLSKSSETLTSFELNSAAPASITTSSSGTVSGIKALGSEPFVVTADLNSPKIIRWSPDVAVPNIDFQLRDCYGDLIPDIFPTEFQMTLLCVEGREWNS